MTAQGKKGAAIVGATWKVKTRQEMNRKLKKPVIVRPVLFATLNAPRSLRASRSRALSSRSSASLSTDLRCR